MFIISCITPTLKEIELAPTFESSKAVAVSFILKLFLEDEGYDIEKDIMLDLISKNDLTSVLNKFKYYYGRIITIKECPCPTEEEIMNILNSRVKEILVKEIIE